MEMEKKEEEELTNCYYYSIIPLTHCLRQAHSLATRIHEPIKLMNHRFIHSFSCPSPFQHAFTNFILFTQEQIKKQQTGAEGMEEDS